MDKPKFEVGHLVKVRTNDFTISPHWNGEMNVFQGKEFVVKYREYTKGCFEELDGWWYELEGCKQDTQGLWAVNCRGYWHFYENWLEKVE